MPDDRVSIDNLTTAPDLGSNDALPVVHEVSGVKSTFKATLTAIGTFINKILNYSADLQTTNKTVIGAINELHNGGGGGGMSSDIIADTYDDTATYNTGDYCIYNDGLYICDDDNVTGAWDSTKWTSIQVMSSIPTSATNLPIESGSATNTKDYIDSSINAPIKSSEVVTIPNGDLAVGSNWSEGCSYVKRNGLIILHLALQGLTANTRNDVYTLPSNCRPSIQIVGAGMGGNSYTAFAQATITTGGVVQVSSVDTYARIHLMYYVNE